MWKNEGARCFLGIQSLAVCPASHTLSLEYKPSKDVGLRGSSFVETGDVGLREG